MVSNNFLTKLETIEPRPTETIVLYVDSNIKIDELEVMFKIAQKEFPNNEVICISDKVSLELWDKDTLKSYISTLNEIVEKL